MLRNLFFLNRFYFIVPAANPNEQFFYLGNLISWLLELSGQIFETPGQFDDPNASAANMSIFTRVFLKSVAAELKKAGIPFEYGPLKLKQGYGEAVVYALQSLADKAFKSKGIHLQKPNHKSDE